MAGSSHRPAGHVGALAHRRHGRSRAWPRADPVLPHRRHPRRAHHGICGARGSAGRCLREHGRGVAEQRPGDARGLLRHRHAGFHLSLGAHQHHADRSLPRCRQARSGGGHRACGRRLRRRDRHGPCRGAPEELLAAGSLPAHHPHRHAIRHRRVRSQPGCCARRGRLQRTACRAGPPPCRRRRQAARHRVGDLRRAHRRRRTLRVRGSGTACGRSHRGSHRFIAVRAGPPHLVGHAHLRPHRRADAQHRHRPRRHRRGTPRRGDRRLTFGAAGRYRHLGSLRHAGRSGPLGGGDPAGSRPGRYHARHRGRRVPRCGHPGRVGGLGSGR